MSRKTNLVRDRIRQYAHAHCLAVKDVVAQNFVDLFNSDAVQLSWHGPNDRIRVQTMPIGHRGLRRAQTAARKA